MAKKEALPETCKDVLAGKKGPQPPDTRLFKVGDVVTLKSGGGLMTVTQMICGDWLGVSFSTHTDAGTVFKTEEIDAACLRLPTVDEVARARHVYYPF